MKTSDRKIANKSNVVRYILDTGAASKAGIAKYLGLSMPTVLQIVKELTESGLVEEVGEYQSTGGRKAKTLALCGGARVSLGIDITANHISMVMINLNGEILRQLRMRKVFRNHLDYYDEMAALAEQFITESKMDPDKILGIGISFPGIVNDQTQTLIRSHALGLENVSLKTITQTLQPYPVYYENDANAAMAAEVTGGSGNSIYLSLSNTVGGAICMDGVVFRGANQKAGEFGHMLLIPGGRRCYCGKNGCVDAYCSARVLAGEQNQSLEAFMARVAAKEPEAGRVWEEYLYHLALTISNLRMAFDMDIILGGYVGGYLERDLLKLGKMVMEHNLFDSDISYIKTCKYQKEASAVGAAKYFIDRYVAGL